MRVNAFDIHLSGQILDVGMSAHAGCFPTLSRANHDCMPNTMFHFSQKTFSGLFHAMRDIAEAEEITVAYIDEHAPRAQRQEHLQERYGFSCTCSTCSLPHAKVKNSDARREAIKDILQEFIACSETDPTPPRYTLAELQQVMDWAKQEGLTARHVRLKYYACRTVAAHIDAELAFKWLKDTRREVIQVFGKDVHLLESVDCGGIAVAAMLTRMGRPTTWSPEE